MAEAWLEFLGSGGGAPLPEAWPPSVLISFHGIYGLLDAGEGAQIRLMEAGVGPGRLDFIAITHMHGDHVFGLPGLIQSMSLSSRARELYITGPEGLFDWLERTFAATGFTPSFSLKRAELPLVLNRGKAALEVKSFKTCHTGDSVGYVIAGYKKSGESYTLAFKLAYTGDTSACQEVVRALKAEGRIDVLVFDSTFDSSMRSEAGAYGHSTTVEAASVARELDVGVLLLFHVSSRYKGESERLLLEARSVFERSFIAGDGLRFIIA